MLNIRTRDLSKKNLSYQRFFQLIFLLWYRINPMPPNFFSQFDHSHKLINEYEYEDFSLLPSQGSQELRLF